MAQKNNKKGKRTPAYSTDTMVVCLIVGLLLIALGVLIFLANALGMTGDVFDGLRQFSRGMCGVIAIALPVIPIWGGVLMMISIQRKPSMRPFLLAILMLALVCAAATLLTFYGSYATSLVDHIQSIIQASHRPDSMPAYLTQGFLYGHQANTGGGLIGMLLAWPLWKGLGAIFSAILVILGAAVTFLFLIRLDVKGILRKAQLRKEERRAQAAAQEAAQRQQELMWQQEQMRFQQEQRRMQEQMRQQQLQQQMQRAQPYPQNYQQMGYQEQAVPIVKQVQPRGQAANVQQQQHGFQPTPEELGQVNDAPQPMPETGRKKRGGVFNREKAEDAVAIPRRRSFFDRDAEEAPVGAAPDAPTPTAPVRASRTNTVRQQTQPNPTVPVFPSEEEAPPRRRSIFQRPEPEMDEPEVVYTEEPQIFTQPEQPKPAAATGRRAAAAAGASAGRMAAAPAPAAPERKPIAPPEEVDTDFAAETQEKPVNENSFLARLRAAKKAAGLEVPENDEDFVLLKSDGIPTYHFAHAVDDHLMKTTHVIRGEDWLPSLPKHIQLFRFLGFKMPKYLHTAQILKSDENGGKKKLSKRDMGAKMDDYRSMGYATECVWEYILTLLNSNFEEWHAQNAAKSYLEFPFNIKKMSVSGCLFDFNKLNDVSKNVLSKMTADEIYEKTVDWAEDFDPEFHAKLTTDPAYTKKIFAIGRGGKKPRKDYATFREIRPFIDFFYDDLFAMKESYPEKFAKDDIRAVLEGFAETYNAADDMNAWFEKIQKIGESLGYTADMKAYKADPEAFKGNVADVSMFIRIAVTGKQNSPDMYAVMQVLGEERVLERVKNALAAL